MPIFNKRVVRPVTDERHDKDQVMLRHANANKSRMILRGYGTSGLRLSRVNIKLNKTTIPIALLMLKYGLSTMAPSTGKRKYRTIRAKGV